MLAMAIFTVQWETQAWARGEHTAAGREAWLAKELQLAAQSAQVEDRRRAGKPAIARLVSVLATMPR
jgi:hypothetical protein